MKGKISYPSQDFVLAAYSGGSSDMLPSPAVTIRTLPSIGQTVNLQILCSFIIFLSFFFFFFHNSLLLDFNHLLSMYDDIDCSGDNKHKEL